MLRAAAAHCAPKKLRPASCRQLPVLDASQFQHIISDEGYTGRAYAGDLLATVGFAQRGVLLETLARRMLQREYPSHSIQSADVQSLGTCSNGRRRSLYHAAWDWVFMDRRVELKSAQLCFDKTNSRWRVAFHSVKLSCNGERAEQPFDDLFLLVYAPDGFYLIKHDLKTGVSTNGVKTESTGHKVQVRSDRRQTCWKAALQTILFKLTVQGCCKLVAYAARSDPLAQELCSNVLDSTALPAPQAYKGIPLSTMNPSIRALRIQEIAYELDKIQNPESSFQSAKGEISPRGYTRSDTNAAVDWVRDGVRVEVKSAKLSFHSGRKMWQCKFSNIKAGMTRDGRNAYFDELWLAIYSPSGIDVFKHWNWRAGLSGSGVRTAAEGKQLLYSGGKKGQSFSSALQRIKTKLEKDGANHHFTIRWTAT